MKAFHGAVAATKAVEQIGDGIPNLRRIIGFVGPQPAFRYQSLQTIWSEFNGEDARTPPLALTMAALALGVRDRRGVDHRFNSGSPSSCSNAHR